MTALHTNYYAELSTCGYFNFLYIEKWFSLQVLSGEFDWGLIVFNGPGPELQGFAFNCNLFLLWYYLKAYPQSN